MGSQDLAGAGLCDSRRRIKTMAQQNNSIKNYWAIHMGEANKYATEAHDKSFIGIGWDKIGKNLSEFQQLDKKEFFATLEPIVKKAYDEETKNISSIIGNFFRFISLMKIGDIVLMPKTAEGIVYLGVITSDYVYAKDSDGECQYSHRRNMQWLKTVDLAKLSDEFRKSLATPLTVISVSDYGEEIEELIQQSGESVASHEFSKEAELEAFIVSNWERLPLSKHYSLIQEDGKIISRQYVTPIGRIDILAKHKNGKGWLIIELKKDRSSDEVVGQTLRYMAWIKENEANGEEVRGLVISRTKDEKLHYALKAAGSIDYMTYHVSFELQKEAI